MINKWTGLRLANAYGGEDIDMAYTSLSGISSAQAKAELEEAVEWLYAVDSAEEAEKERFEEINRAFLNLVGERARRKHQTAFRLMLEGISAKDALKRAREEIGDYRLAEIYEARRDHDAILDRRSALAREHQFLWPIAVALFHKANRNDLAA